MYKPGKALTKEEVKDAKNKRIIPSIKFIEAYFEKEYENKPAKMDKLYSKVIKD